MKTSTLEQKFRAMWAHIGPSGYELVSQHRFHSTRKWRFDFALKSHKIAIETEGLIFSGRGGRHQRASGFIADCHKYNAATSLGWRVLRYTSHDLQSRPIQVIEEIEAVICLVEGLETKCR